MKKRKRGKIDKMEAEDKKEEEVDSDDDLFVKFKQNEKINQKRKSKQQL